ncbi:MAG: hypothetical protein IJE23_04665 [Tyzzerella sp.]|nr:hypothetical protein [Tyzzerella sp.]
MKKLVALMLSAVMLVSMAGCGAKVIEEEDDSKTTLYIGTFDGGVGTEWLEKAIEKFEDKYADVSFEEGKKGVQLIIGEKNRTTMHGTELEDLISASKTEVFFTQGVFYHDWVNRGLLYDITDIATEKLTDYDEEKSILDKMNEDYAQSMLVDEKIYALPFWEGIYGFVYNATLFDENEWYFAADGTFTDASGDLGVGPDGKAGTYDDGMPATYDDFFQLCSQIAEDNVVPVQWGSPDYFTWLIAALWADYEGYEDTMMNFTFEGEEDLVKLNTVDEENLTYETEKVAITAENGYELVRQEGYLHALSFAERLLQNTSYYDANVSLSTAYKTSDTQLSFVRNAYEQNAKPIAMIIEGSWWENEAVTAFQETYGTNATKYDNEMEMKWMPLPKATEAQIGSPNVQVSPLDSYCFINANIADSKVEVAKLFLQFCHTDAMMAEFTEVTGMFKPYDYALTEGKSTDCVESVVEIRENSRMLFPMSDHPVYTFSAINFRLANLFTSKYDSNAAATPIMSTVLTAKDGTEYKYDFMEYWKGMVQNRKEILWPTLEDVLK